MNTISVIGTGYVGLVTGTCLAEFGLNVICMDIDQKKIENLEKGIIPIYEPGLDDLVHKNVKTGRLKFTTNIETAVANSIAIFIAVGTPPRDDGSADMQYVLAAASSIAGCMDSYKVIVDKSTVPLGTARKVDHTIRTILKERNVTCDFDVVSNPEFLREGAAIKDFMHPDRIVIGTDSGKAREIMKNIYRVLYLNNHPMLFTNLETAELIKYAANAFLATKISFINEVSELCEAAGANVQDVAKGMGLDGRIGKYFLHAGPGYGGSCFPKDTKAFVKIGKENGIQMSIVDAVISANEKQKLRMVEKIEKATGNLAGKKLGILGLSFKPETDDMREAPSIVIVKELLKRGAILKVFDPISMGNAQKYIFEGLDIYYSKDEYDAITDADALVLLTEWNQFRSLDLEKIKDLMKDNKFFDFRNIYEKEMMQDFGFEYFAVGR